MRTFTVVPSFDGDSAFFELPDIGFQGDNLSFAILFNLTELTEHWPDIVPSMIVTDPENNTFIAPHVTWSPSTHIFTWYISEVETAYKGVVRCQLKCTKTGDPNTIVCMSRICQTRVFESLAASTDPPEAFQSWIDALVQLGAEIQADANTVLDNVETTVTNARTAQLAAEAAEAARDEAISASESVEQAAATAESAVEAATQAQQRAQAAATAAASAQTAAEAAKESVDDALEEIDQGLATVQTAANSAADSAAQAANSMASANSAKLAAESARNDSVAARISAETAQQRAETAQGLAEGAQGFAETAQSAAETAQGLAETAQGLAETAQSAAEAAQNAAEDAQDNAELARDAAQAARAGVENYAEESKKWATGYDKNGAEVLPVDPMYENSSRYWAGIAAANAGIILGYGLYVDEDGNGYIRTTT